MCGRVAQHSDPAKLARRFGIAGVAPNAPPRYNGAPTDDILVVRFNPESGERLLGPLRWGLVPLWAKDLKDGAKMINARAESCTDKPAFRDAFRRRRCLVPVDAFYEWRAQADGKQPFAIALADGEPMALAGLWERWRAPHGQIVRSFTIITTMANALVAQLHDRMPVILAPADWPAWLGEQEASEDELKRLLRPYPADGLRMWPVGRRVNRVGQEGPDLLAAITA